MAQQESARATPLDVNPHCPPNNDSEQGRSQDAVGSNMVARAPSFMITTGEIPSQQVNEAQAAAAELLRRVGKNIYLPLFHAATKGDWRSARNFVNEHGTDFGRTRITIGGETVLIVAARSCQWQFVRKLAALLSPEVLAIQDGSGFTALHYVAVGGSLKTAKALVQKNSALPQIQAEASITPLLFSLTRPNKAMAWYLTMVTRDESPSPSCPFTGTRSFELLFMLVASRFTDIALYIIKRYSGFAFVESRNQFSVLQLLAYNPSIFLSGSKLKFWERWILKFVQAENELPPHSMLNGSNSLGNPIPSPIGVVAQALLWFKLLLRKAASILVPRIKEAKLQHLCAIKLVEDTCEFLASRLSIQGVADYMLNPMTVAARRGTVEILRIFLEYFPDLTFSTLGSATGKRNILQIAIEDRQADTFNLINEMPLVSRLLAGNNLESGETTLFLAAKLAPSPKLLSVSGAALQMQRELQWFKEVEKLMHPALIGMPNNARITADELFREQHGNLAEKGEKWMKDTANSCMLVSTLIATVVFAAAFTVPGGNINDKGIPIFLGENLFKVFAISDALALFSSTTSVLMFLSILTARYTQEDFLLVLPKRLIIGLGSLFVSIITMMVAFGATLFIVLSERWQWVYFPIMFLASIPIATFGLLQLPLFIKMVQSTYGSGILHVKI